MEGLLTLDYKRWRYVGLLTILIVCALCLATRLAYLFLADATRFPINTVKVAATYQHVTHQQLETVLSDYMATSFFALPVRKLHQTLSAIPWVQSVKIERVWPDTLKIYLTEKVPAAIWNNSFLTADGELFDAGDYLNDSSLLHLNGPPNQQREVLQVYEKLSTILSNYKLHASLMVLRENQAWELSLTNGVQLHLGKRELDKRLLRFCKSYPAVFAGKSLELVSVDLRYPRGMAVQWKQVAEK